MQNLKTGYILLLFFWLPAVAFSQIRQYAPGRKAAPKTSIAVNAKRHAVNPVSLPFWDDFSFAKGHHADSLLWIVNDKVFVNDGQAINPPSINVATFDGYNENGRPYSTVPLETGYGDTLESQPIRMADVAAQYRDKIYLSFFYQAGGNSEMPNPSDFLKLEFKSTEGWVEIHRFSIKSNADPSVFYDTAIQIPVATLPGEQDYFHNQFQFRFTSFGRLSGSYDAWHLDYVYLNRRVNDNEEIILNENVDRINENDKNTNISDRTTTRPFTSIFGDYYSVPNNHFNIGEALTNPAVSLYSLKYVDFLQVVSYIANYKVTNYASGTPTVSYNQSPDGGETSFDLDFDGIPILEHVTAQTKSTAPSSAIDPEADSTHVDVKIILKAGDNDPGKDYYARYAPINFQRNDTLEHTFILSNYYAYDDGVAEYSAGLAAQGNQLAYRFVMDSNVGQDTLNGISFYFPFTGGTAPETIKIFVFKDKAGKPDSASAYSQTVPVVRSSDNIFYKIDFTEGVLVQDTFYIGYEETVTAKPDRIRIGLDASHDTGNQMYYRNTVYHPWVQNTDLKGSLMIRPRFGKATVITGTEDNIEPVAIYPNPNRGEFYVQGRADNIQIISLTGQSAGFTTERSADATRVTLQNPHPGVYIIRFRSGSKISTGKILVTEN
ncbi:MAG TPA: T9SS type A sorting domain-containing protein [Cyclobacteriaceae bacterium]|nr:T9SS type A sorting domain-containing protein [Cyclobacteriaceae bacterium]HMV09614.1 T9SS type A sorting domain-containing protein [Cyclobacteriaceae bacterium]HMV90233.1 T9SS type A sorting domain-containing protein [Cyclobacteriaceae bacterium]HMX01054.1 T9SS type A sorting domain-containing protein [Cyclobacteriaceae bacterium]HMX51775.1 T9SS type A sorting domain-containing protein [Cyclobacteriaceae bacterium]